MEKEDGGQMALVLGRLSREGSTRAAKDQLHKDEYADGVWRGQAWRHDEGPLVPRALRGLQGELRP